jgi:hypothetical protein
MQRMTLTLEALRNYLDKYDTEISNARLEHLKGLPFYDWNNNSESNDFNHAIGLPQKSLIHCLYIMQNLMI